MTKIYIKPAPGMIVRGPVSFKVLPEEGALVKPSTYWNRRLKDGSVVLVTPEAPTPEPAKPSKKKERP